MSADQRPNGPVQLSAEAQPDTKVETPAAPSTEPEFLTIREAAALLRVNRKTIDKAIEREELPGVRKMGRTVRIHRATLLSFGLTGQGRGPGKRGRK